DFSKTVDAQGRAAIIYDPYSTTAGGSGFVRTPFAGNLIPANRMDPVGVNFMKGLYPLPNITPAPGAIQNYFDARPRTFKWNSLSSRVDENLSAKHQLFFRFGWNHRTDDGGALYFPGAPYAANGADVFERGNIAGGVGETWIKSSRTVVDFRLGFSRYY